MPAPTTATLAIEVQRHDLVASLSVFFLNAVKTMNLDLKVSELSCSLCLLFIAD